MTVQIPISAWEPILTPIGAALTLILPLGVFASGLYMLLCGLRSKDLGVFEGRDLVYVGAIVALWGGGFSIISLCMNGVIEFT